MPASGGILLALLLAGAPLPTEEQQALQAKAAALDQQMLALYRAGRGAETVSLAEQALALRRQLYPKERFPDGHRDLANSLDNLGFMLQVRGDFARAEAFCQEALTLRRRLFPKERFPDGHLDVAMSLNNVATVLQALGEPARAEPLLREALAMRRRLAGKGGRPEDDPNLAGTLSNLGYVLEARGDLAGAEGFVREALAMRQRLYPRERFPLGHPDLATNLNNLGTLLQARGDLARAEAILRETLAMRRRLFPPKRFPAGHADLAQSLGNLGVLLRVRDKQEEAEAVAREVLAMNRALYPKARYPDGHAYLANSLHNLGILLQDRGKLDDAEALLRECLQMRRALFPPKRFARGHPDLAATLDNLGVLRAEQGDRAGAEALYREALAMRRRLYPPEHFPAGHPLLAITLGNLGSLRHQQGDRAGAAAFLDKALRMQRAVTEGLLAGAAEAEMLNHLAHVPLTRDHYLSVTHSLADQDAASYLAVWQTRSLLARWLAQRRLSLLASADPDIRALDRRLTETRRELAQLLLAGGAGAGRVRELADRKEQLEKELARRLPAVAAFQESAGRTPADLQRALPAGMAFIDLLRYVRFEYPTGKGRGAGRRTHYYVAFVLGRDQPLRRVELGPAAAIEEAASAVGEAIRKPKSEDRQAAALGRLLWAPLAAQLPPGTETIYLVPDAALTGVPWAALPGKKAGMVLLEDYALAVVPHGHFLLETLAGARQHRGQDMLLAVGDVAYDRPPAAALSWPALPGTARELDRVLGLAGKRLAVVRRGPAASTGQLLTDLPQTRWAHLATHGFFADAKLRSVLHLSEKDDERGGTGEKIGVGARNPLVLSGLVLAGANRTAADAPADRGILTAEAIAGLNLDEMELAVLSACDTGRGEVAGGEGVFGLQRAFHIAGARNVIASLWQVDDEATAALMGLFYHQLWIEKKTPLEALRQAQLTLYHHPERIGQLARLRGPDFEKAARLPATSGAASARRSPARLWAGFILSGLGR
jgi:CHAT domain-containing protein/Tfp pilus assembly protein PilF